MGRKTAEQADLTRRALLNAGIARFAENGYAGTALEELMQSLGITRGALYHHFKNKRRFFEAAVEVLQRDLGRKIEAAAAKAGDGWAGVEGGCSAFLLAATDPTYRQIVLIDGPSVLGWQTWKRLDDEHLTSLLERGLAGVDAPPPDTHALAIALSGAMNELALWVAHEARPRATLKRARAVVRELIRAAAARS